MWFWVSLSRLFVWLQYKWRARLNFIYFHLNVIYHCWGNVPVLLFLAIRFVFLVCFCFNFLFIYGYHSYGISFAVLFCNFTSHCPYCWCCCCYRCHINLLVRCDYCLRQIFILTFFFLLFSSGKIFLLYLSIINDCCRCLYCCCCCFFLFQCNWFNS